MSRVRRGTVLGIAFGLGLIAFIYFWPVLEGKTLEEISWLQEMMRGDGFSADSSSVSGLRLVPIQWAALRRESQEIIRRYLSGNDRQKRFIVMRVLSRSESDRESTLDWSDLRNWPFERNLHMRALHDVLSEDRQGLSDLYYIDPEGQKALAMFFQLLETGRTDPGFRAALTAFNDAHRNEGDYSP